MVGAHLDSVSPPPTAATSSTTATIPQGPGAPGSELIERALTEYFGSIGVPIYKVDFEGRSDYAPFLSAGIPVGGLLTRTREIKPQSMADMWGGTAGQPFDPCYHLACDTNANINETIYLRNANAAAHAFWTLCTRSTRSTR